MSLHSKMEAVDHSEATAELYRKLADEMMIRAEAATGRLEIDVFETELERLVSLADEMDDDAEYRREQIFMEYGPERVQRYLDRMA